MSSPTPPIHEDAMAMLAEQRALTQLGLIDLQARWEQQPDLQVLTVGEGNQANQTIRGFPEAAFHGIAIYNPTLHQLRVNFSTGGADGAPLIVPARTMLVWPVEYAHLSVNSDTAKPAEQILLLRLRYPPGAPALYDIPLQGARENFSEEEQNEAATVKLKVKGRPGRKIVVTNLSGQFSAAGAVATEKLLEGTIKSGANTIFRFNLTQLKTAGAGATSTYISGPVNLTLAEGEELTIEVTGAEANARVTINASGYVE